jgi:small subunit ribosomal protein S6e
MKQGVLTAQRVKILFRPGMSCYRPRKRGERKRKSVRGCIVSSDLSVLNLVVVKKGDSEIEGLTDASKPRRLGPKRASKIRKLFNLEKKDDVKKYVIRRQIVKDGKKPVFKAPKIQRLVTPARLQHRRQVRAEKRSRYESTKKLATEYNEIVAKRHKEAREEKKVAKRRSESRKLSEKPAEAKPAATKAAAPKAVPAKAATKPSTTPSTASKPAASQPKATTQAKAPVATKPAAAPKTQAKPQAKPAPKK